MGDRPEQVSHPLQLTLELKDPRQMPVLMAILAEHRERTRAILDALRFVHFARFLPTRHNTTLVVVTEFDGPLETYVMDFAITLGDLFDDMLRFVKDAPPLPIRDNPDEFLAFVRRNNQVVIRPGDPLLDDGFLYSAYPHLTTVDILQANPAPDTDRNAWQPAFFENAPAEPVDRADVQGNVLHSHRWDVGRHWALRIDDTAGARRFLKAALDRDLGAGLGVTRDADFRSGGRLGLCLTLGFTASGLLALGVPEPLLEKFPAAFREGPAHPVRARAHGDVGDNGPEHWRLGGAAGPVDVLVSLQAITADTAGQARYREACAALVRWWSGRGGGQESERRGDGLVLMDEIETVALAGSKVHFGYSDGLSQPRIAGVSPAGEADPPRTDSADRQPTVGVGQFVLGDYTDVYGGRSIGKLPRGLCDHGTFAAVRVMEQFVDVFERFIRGVKTEDGRLLHPEYVAAKLLGRWRSGRPLTDDRIRYADERHPDEVPVTRREWQELNAFDYRDPDPDRTRAERVQDDRQGLVCPIGSHVRRMNPRSARVSGKPNTRRILRRGMVYGPAWNPAQPDDGVRRGLFGVFICGDLERQYEFLLRHWALGHVSAPGLRGTSDPIVDPSAEGSDFEIPLPDRAPIRVRVPRLVKTVGSLYLLMPGLGGLRCLAEGTGFDGEAAPPQRSGAARRRTATEAFHPRDPAFLADPYPFYARFRETAPVALVRSGAYRSYWVFTPREVAQVCDDDAVYRKPKKSVSGVPTGAPSRGLPTSSPPETHDQGLFYMDLPRHRQVRPQLDDALLASSAGIESVARMLADQALRRIPGTPFDLVADYARRAARDVFLSLFGVPQDKWETVGSLAEKILLYGDAMLPAGETAVGDVARAGLASELMQLCPMHRDNPGLFERMHDDRMGMNLMETLLTAGHFVMGGYLSTDFLVGTGMHTLIRHGLVDEFIRLDSVGRRRAIREMARFDAPFQMADRVTARATTLGGVDIPAGHLVTVVYGSANRALFADGDRFRMDREFDPRDGFAFGRGIHYCIGAALFDRVAPILFDRLLKARPRLVLAAPARRLRNPYFRGFESLPLTSPPPTAMP